MFEYLTLNASIQVNLVLSTDEGLALETSAFESLYGGSFTLSTQLIKPNYLVILPPTQHHSFFTNLPPLLDTSELALFEVRHKLHNTVTQNKQQAATPNHTRHL